MKFEKDYFEGTSSNYKSGYRLDPEKKYVFNYVIDQFLSDLLHEEKRDVLDVGCATGIFLEVLKERHPNISISGADISKYAIQECKKRLSGGFKIFDFNKKKWPLADQSYDIILAFEVIEHLSHEENFLQNTYNVLRPGGYFLFSCPMKSGWIRRLLDKDETHINLNDSKYYLKQLAKYNFEVVASKKIATFGWPPTVFLRNALNFRGKPIETRYDFLTQDQIYLCKKRASRSRG